MRIFFGLSTVIGLPRPVMIFNLMSLNLKIPLNFVFIYGWVGLPEMGAPGCAAVTAVDVWLMAYIALGWYLRHPDSHQFRLRRRFVAPDFKTIGEFLRLGIRVGMAIAVVFSLIFWLAAPHIAALYTTDLRVQAAAIPLISVVALYLDKISRKK